MKTDKKQRRTPEEQKAYRKEYMKNYGKQYKKDNAERINKYNREWRAKRTAEFKRLKELEKSLNTSAETDTDDDFFLI